MACYGDSFLLLPLFLEVPGSNYVLQTVTMNDNFHGFSKSLLENSGIVILIGGQV
jgi:hypothetical protein